MIKQAVLIGALSQLRKKNSEFIKKTAAPIPVPEPGIFTEHLKPLWSRLKGSPHTIPVLLGITGAMILKSLLD